MRLVIRSFVGLLAAAVLLLVIAVMVGPRGVGTSAIHLQIRMQVTDQATGGPIAGARALIMDPILLAMDQAWIDQQTDAWFDDQGTEHPRYEVDDEERADVEGRSLHPSASSDASGQLIASHMVLVCSAASCPASTRLGDTVTLAVVLQAEGYERFGPATLVARRIEGDALAFDLGTLPLVRSASR